MKIGIVGISLFLSKEEEEEYIKKLIQDMRVHARDLDDFSEEQKYKSALRKLQRGFQEEYKK